MIDLENLIEQTNDLAPLPASAVRLSELVCDPDCHLDEVADLIAFDQALTLKLLRAANSAASASANPVVDVHDAVIRMGTAQVLAFAIAVGAKTFLQPAIPAYGLEEGALWRHSVAAAAVAEAIQAFGRVEVPSETFPAALLHDVGKLVMGRFLNPEILDFIRRAQEVDHLGQLEAESLLLNVNHGELGGLVAQHWKLPPRVVQGIIYHHNPEQGMDVICDFTHLCDQFAKRIEASLDGRHFDLALQPGVVERLELTPEMLDDFFPLAARRYTEVCRRYGSV